MITTIDTITDEQIEALKQESGEAGDPVQVAICLVALGRTDDERVDGHRRELEVLGVIPEHVDGDVRARALCVEAIQAAEAMVDR